MSTRHWLASSAAAALAFLATHGFGQSTQKKDLVDTPPLPGDAQVMQAKLKHAQALMAALAKEDYAQLEVHASALVAITRATEFLREYKTEEYEFRSRAFQKSAESLVEKARKKNIDGATLAFPDMNISCLGCHTHFRGKPKN